MPKVRLDTLLVERGLAASRERARALVLAGQVRVAGQVTAKAGTLVDPAASLDVVTPDHPYVGRGGLKLAHALDAFGLDPSGLRALDIGASTGGFTDVLLRRGARVVVALDVGRGQLAWPIRSDPRVVVIEGMNARNLSPAQFPEGLREFDLITIDVSFISLRLVLPAVLPLVAHGGSVIALVKPQFEAGRDAVGPGGIVTDPVVHARVLDDVRASAQQAGLRAIADTPSPITGAEGNREFFLLLRSKETEP